MDKNKKILLVEDDEGFLLILKESFEDTEFFVITAKDGEEGFLKAKNESPDLILLDIMLPKIDGIKMALKLKEDGVRIPIIYLTNVKDSERISEAVEIGEGDVDYIVKTDVNIEDIIDRIRRRLNLTNPN